MSDNILIKAENIHKIYNANGKSVQAVNGITVEFERTKSVAIVGHSGAGKSTLLHMVGGLDRPSSGKMFIDKQDIYGLPDSKRAAMRNSRIGFVFQFYNLLNEFTATENVTMPYLIANSGFGRAKIRSEAKAKASDMLKRVGLSGRLNHKPSELSGGEQQRVAIARALINNPEILLCDEPTGNLDTKTSASIYELLFGLQSGGLTLLIVTHDESIVNKVSRVIRLEDGKIA